MVSAGAKVINPQGLHMRPAQVFVSAMKEMDCNVRVLFNGKSIDAKSILSLMAACIKQGSEIEIQCSGPQEKEALQKALELLESGLGDM